ncbi:MAG: flagellar cap protein FliD N-terminal domain-containing protein, partial [Clostridia bacterium]
MTTMNRITGTNSGIDVDTVVKQSLTNEQNKIDKAYQQQMVYTYQQNQLNEIVKSGQDFYSKYLDILSSNSLLKTSAYETVKFTSTDSKGNKTTAVTAKGYAGAEIGNYSVSVSQIAKKASTTLNEKSLQSIVDRGNGVIAVSMKNSEGKDVTAYVDAVFTDGEINLKSTAEALNIELKKSGLNVSAKYSEFSKGIVLESGNSGNEASFGVSTAPGHSISENIGNDKETFKNLFDYKYYQGQNAKGTITKGSGKDAVVYQIDSNLNTINVDNVQFTFNSATTGSVVENLSSDVHSSYSNWNDVDEGTTVTLEGKDGKTTV